jgi:predicted transposase YbfD/YdcC
MLLVTKWQIYLVLLFIIKVTQGVEVSTTLQAIELLIESAKIILPSTTSALILVNCFESSLNEDAYSSHQLNSERLNGIIKNHWAVENSLH